MFKFGFWADLSDNHNMITVKNLTYDYPTVRALQHVSFKVEPNTITALVGPNGAGKTTLLRCLAALDIPLTGKITVNKLNIEDYPREVHRIMGYLPDFYGLYKDLTVKQCLMYHAMAQNIPKPEREQLVLHTAERLQIEDHLSKEVSELSRGQQQRVGIGQAIIHHPKVLLLDEPAAGLDPEARNHLAQLLVNLSGEDMTIIVSSHILSELQDYCSHMLVLREGKVITHCKIDEISKSMTEVYFESV